MTARRFVVALFVLAVVPAVAGAAVPPDVASRISAAAANGREVARIAAERARQADDPVLAQMMQANARNSTLTTMDAVVIDAIARHPAMAGEIVAAAGRAAPDIAPDIARAAARAFPFLSTAAPPPPPAPAPAAPAAPAPAPKASAARLPEEIDDPLEDVNRAIFAFNDVVDRFLLRPIAWVYGKVAPPLLKTAVNNGFKNVASPVRLANDLFQLDLDDAGTTLARFAINSTVGAGGLFDVASRMGLPYRPADFGQTLFHYGIGPGPYIVVPVLGPSTLRDGTGTIADTFLDPFTYLLDSTTNLELLGGRIITKRETLIEPLDKLRKGSVDYYAALRSAYYQDRAVELRKGRPAAPAAQRELDQEFENAE